MSASGNRYTGQDPLAGFSTAGNTNDIQTRQLKEQQRQFDLKYGLYKDLMAGWSQQNTGLNNLLNQYNQAYNEAKFKNEQKYNQMLGVVDSTTGQQRADTISNFQQRQADEMQNLARLGMANTSGASTLKQGVARDQQSALNRLADQMAQTKLGVMQNFEYKGLDPQVFATAISAAAPKYPTLSF